MPIGTTDLARKTVLDIVARLWMIRRLGGLWSPGCPTCCPPRDRGSMFQLTASSCYVAGEFARHCRMASPVPASNFPNADLLGMHQINLFSL